MNREDPETPSLQALQAKIDAARKAQETGKKPGSPAGDAMRIAIDLVSGVAVGSIGGYLLDRWLGTMPLFLLLGFFLGLAAGVKLMMQTARELSKQLEQEAEASKKE